MGKMKFLIHAHLLGYLETKEDNSFFFLVNIISAPPIALEQLFQVQ